MLYLREIAEKGVKRLISEGWCIEAMCDRCRKAVYLPYRRDVNTLELLQRIGWRPGEKDLCPECAALRDRAMAQPPDKKRKHKRLSGKWPKPGRAGR